MRIDVHVQTVSKAYEEAKSRIWHREGSDDYTDDRTHIEEVVDAQGRSHQPVWGARWTALAPGIESRSKGQVNRVRVYATACPVRIRFRSTSKYVSYSDSEFSSRSSSEYWVRYERHAQHPSESTGAVELLRKLVTRLARLFGSMRNR